MMRKMRWGREKERKRRRRTKTDKFLTTLTLFCSSYPQSHPTLSIYYFTNHAKSCNVFLHPSRASKDLIKNSTLDYPESVNMQKAIMWPLTTTLQYRGATMWFRSRSCISRDYSKLLVAGWWKRQKKRNGWENNWKTLEGKHWTDIIRLKEKMGFIKYIVR